MTRIDHVPYDIDEGTLVAGRYRLSRWLSLGATGEIWSARDERLGRDVAMKLIKRDPKADPSDADLFTREAIAAARINHPNVVHVYDQGEYQGHRFLVMELIVGRTLDELRAGRPMPIGAALAVAVQIARALEAAHEVGIVHRDVKPANIMVTHDGVVKVVDFGIAQFAPDGDGVTRYAWGAATAGTPAFTAPERINGGESDARSDLYSLGCVLYTLLTGMPPFVADDAPTILRAHIYDAPVPPHHWRNEIPPEIDQLVVWLLAKDPGARPANAAIVAGRLESLASAYPTPGGRTVPSMDELLATTAVMKSPPDAGPMTVADVAARPDGPEPQSGKRRRRRLLPAFLLLCIAAGLVIGVTLSRQQTVLGTMPNADAAKTHSQSAAPKTPPQKQTTMPSAPPSSMMPTPSSPSGSGGTGGTGGGAMVQSTNVTPDAPITPYSRYSAVVPGNGCITLAPGQYECMVGRDGGAPVFQAGSHDVVGTLGAGGQPFYCQAPGAEYTHGGFSNHWWAWTESAQGQWGWVSAVDLSGGDNDQPEPGLPYCGS